MEADFVDNKKHNPRESASFLSKLFYLWTFAVFKKGNTRDLSEEDLYKPLKSHKSHLLGNKLEEAWNKQKLKHKSLVRALWRVFRKEIVCYISLNFFLVFLPKLCQPILLMQILNYYIPDQKNISEREASIYIAAIIVIIFIISISGHTYVMGMQQLGIKLRVAICSLIYRKTLKLSKYAMNETSTGQIITLLSNDLRMFDYVMLDICLLIIAPSELIADTILLYMLLGKTALYGIAFLIFIIPLQMYNGKLAATYRLKIARKTDRRILLMSEIISGIQVIKMYTWEKPFAKLVESARRAEVNQIRGAAYVNAFMHSYSMYMSRTAQFISILAFVLSGHIPAAQYVFVVTSFYNNLAKTISVNFPDAISTFAESRVSCKRIENHLHLDEVHHSPDFEYRSNKSSGETAEVVLKMSNISAKWNQHKNGNNSIHGINLEMRSDEKVALIGHVGSGKSTLINVILRELPITQGKLKLNGRISYASQEPWLFKGSIKQNILFGQKMDHSKYKEVIKVCALEKDFDIFPHGDESIVGEKGVMLSGGQKARINLARAIYQDAELYLLDDPLSAVDTHVGKQLFDQCIRGYLFSKCVLLVTHQLQYLRSMNRICVMEEGKIVREGTYQDLHTKSDAFSRLCSHISDDENQNQSEDSVEPLVEKKSLENKENGRKDVKEHISTGAMSTNVYKKYFQSGGNWYIYVPVIFTFFLTQFCASLGDYFITFWVNLEQSRASDKDVTEDSQIYSIYSKYNTEVFIYIYSGIIVMLILFALLRSISFFQYCLSASTKLHNKMFFSIAHAPMRFFNTNPSGRILNRFSKDIGSIDEILPVLLLETIEIAFTVIAVSFILTSVNYWMIFPTIVILTLFYSYKYYYIRTSRSIKRLEGIVRSPIYSHMAASLQGLSTIRAFKLHDRLTEEFDQHQDLHTATYYLFLSCNRAFGVLLDLNCIVYVAVVTVSTFFAASFGGNVGLSITQAMGLTGRMQWGVRQWSETENHMTSVERILEYSSIEPEEESKEKSPTDWPKEGSIEFINLSMRYSSEESPVLKNLSFRIEANEKIGIVGRTGAGKSSIIAAIFRLSTINGTILIDKLDISKISLENLRSRISIIPQEPFLFSGTLRKNLDPFDEFDDATLWNALEEVEMKNLVDCSALGLNLEISEGGSNFSVGQKQLICLARAIMRKNKILIMDEATANVDPDTDELIQTTIRKNFMECTVLTIAHRLHTIMDSDKVLVMKGGRVAQFGHPHDLLNENEGAFFGLVMETGKEVSNNLKSIAEESFNKKRKG